MSKEIKTVTISGPVYRWQIGENSPREFMSLVLPFGEAREIIAVEKFNAMTNKGEQRSVKPNHVKKLKEAVLGGNYTPTKISVGLHAKHQEDLKIKDGIVTLKVSSDNPLPQSNGQHRFSAFNTILSEAIEKSDTNLISQILQAPVSIELFVDGNIQQDFINLQKGLPVDKTMLFTLETRLKKASGFGNPSVSLAANIAKECNKDVNNPLYKQIRFDCRTETGIPVNTLCSDKPCDLSTSFVGLAKVRQGISAEKTSKLFIDVIEELEKYSDLIIEGMLLTPPPDGTKSSTRMLIGLTICLAYKMASLKHELPSKTDLVSLLTCAKTLLNLNIENGASPANRRELIADFATAYFDGLDEEFIDGIPLNLIKILSTSSFNIEKSIKND